MNDIEETAEETSVKHEEEPAPPQNNYSRKCAHWLLFLSWLVYTVGSLGRMNYTASIVAIIWETGESKTSAGIVSSFTSTPSSVNRPCVPIRSARGRVAI